MEMQYIKGPSLVFRSVRPQTHRALIGDTETS